MVNYVHIFHLFYTFFPFVSKADSPVSMFIVGTIWFYSLNCFLCICFAENNSWPLSQLLLHALQLCYKTDICKIITVGKVCSMELFLHYKMILFWSFYIHFIMERKIKYVHYNSNLQSSWSFWVRNYVLYIKGNIMKQVPPPFMTVSLI